MIGMFNVYYLLEKGGAKSVGAPVVRTSEKEGGRKGSGLFCARCGHPITDKDQRMEVNGSHEHTFANPGGHVFRIGCFRDAPGCITARNESMEFTWFAGYSWSASGCSLCGIHIGWCFRLDDDVFFGLTLDSLVEKEASRT
ncbi:MAG: hypothetical protein GY854_29460 [Deltaproteobacteria bacterium]|nr:hypothetical protein [Deltaproteobacteria bacterium]